VDWKSAAFAAVGSIFGDAAAEWDAAARDANPTLGLTPGRSQLKIAVSGSLAGVAGAIAPSGDDK
jgi:hypothetical protein